MDRFELLVSPPTRLGVGDSVGALLTVEGQGYLLQQRDVKPGIFFPGFLSLFGGAIDKDEDPALGIARELNEELGLDIEGLKPFGKIAFDWSAGGIASAGRWFFEAQVPAAALQDIRLGEGSGYQVLSAQACFAGNQLSPIDAFALWFHHCRDHLDPAQA